jgi:N utilization substance protein B
MKVVEYYAHHKKTIIDLINANLAKTWTWARIPQVEKAILITAVCEHHVNKFDRKIIIDQALVSTKHYANPEASGYINAILDKILK